MEGKGREGDKRKWFWLDILFGWEEGEREILMKGRKSNSFLLRRENDL